MAYYQTFPSHKEVKSATATTTTNLSSPTLLYNQLSVSLSVSSAALITAFGRPTLIQYDFVPRSDNAASIEEEEEFTPVRHRYRSGSHSLYSEQPDSIGGELL